MLKNLGARLDAEMRVELKKLDLNISEFAVLMTLLEGEGLTQAEIGRKVLMPGYATTRTLDALEDKKLVQRRPDERSRRSHRIYLADRGRATGPDLFEIVRRVNTGLLSPLGADDVQTLRRLLGMLLASSLGE